MNDVLRNPSVLSVLIALLIVWRAYVRVRRLSGRQQFSRVRASLVILLFTVLLGLLATVAGENRLTLITLAGGTVLGAVIGYIGHRLTAIEQTPDGIFYKPNLHLGIALSLLFMGRVLYRAVKLVMTHGTASTLHSVEFSNPITLGIFSIMAGYYVAFAIALLLWRPRGELTNSQAT